MARGEIVAFIDDDAIADRDWLKKHVRDYHDDDVVNVVGVAGFIVTMWENGRPSCFPEELYWIVGCSYKGLPRGKSTVRNAIGCNMSFKKEVFGKIGYFEARYGSQPSRLLVRSEEAELSLRILKAYPKSRIVYDPSVIVYHKVPTSRKSIRYLASRSFYEGLSKRMLEKSAGATGANTKVTDETKGFGGQLGEICSRDCCMDRSPR